VLRIHPIPRNPVVAPAPIMAPAVSGLDRDDRLKVVLAIAALKRFAEQQNAALITAIDTLNTTVQNIIA